MKIYRIILVVLFGFTFLPNQSRLNAAAEPGSFLIEEYANSGMFAEFASVLGALDTYEKGQFAGLWINFTSGPYLDPERGPNWWEYFFEPIHFGDSDAPHYIFPLNETLEQTGIGFHMPRQRAYELIQKYIHVKKPIQEKVKSFKKKNFKGNYVIGVHYRGTDKILEMPLVPYEKTVNAVRGIINSLNTKAIPRFRHSLPHLILFFGRSR